MKKAVKFLKRQKLQSIFFFIAKINDEIKTAPVIVANLLKNYLFQIAAKQIFWQTKS